MQEAGFNVRFKQGIFILKNVGVREKEVVYDLAIGYFVSIILGRVRRFEWVFGLCNNLR